MDIKALIYRGFEGDAFDSDEYKQMYATDASIYLEWPEAVVFPRNTRDIQLLVKFALENGTSIIPRGAGTSLAGQCVGSGIVMDVSRYMRSILEFDEIQGVVTVEPGVVRDELNHMLRDTDWFFGPNTSTSNRATIGGMVGNNSSGTTSISHGVTRDKLLELEVVLADGSNHIIDHKGFHAMPKSEDVCTTTDDVSGFFEEFVGDRALHDSIEHAYPHPNIHRRNTGYALDYLIRDIEHNRPNWLNIICGSEGTLCAIAKIKIKLDKKPPEHSAIVVSHYDEMNTALSQVPKLLHLEGIFALELMDDLIIECASKTASQRANLFFIVGNPKAVLISELRADTIQELKKLIQNYKNQAHEAYANRIVEKTESAKVWEVRKAGLGVLSNIAGDDQALACIEDTAVNPDVLADYIDAFTKIMASHNQKAIYYAHAGAGEIHLRPVLNLKTESGRRTFETICEQSAKLVKKYNGSLSGEHGDGRVRAPFIKEFYGEEIYASFIKLKNAFDPENIFNPGKITKPKKLLDDIRFSAKPLTQNSLHHIYSYDPDESLFHHAERCNGSGDCRKSHDLSPGMCPTYQATGLEHHTTRARANLVREALSNNGGSSYPLASPDLALSMSSCLSCKACQTECPSGVDVSLMKSEYLYQVRSAGKHRLRDYLLAHPVMLYKLNKHIPIPTGVFNSIGFKLFFNKIGLTDKRHFPLPVRRSLIDILSKEKQSPKTVVSDKKIILAVDEFVNYFDVASGLACYKLLKILGYQVELLPYTSGRALISKGFMKKAVKVVEKNIELFHHAANRAHAIVGVEPSALLSFRDEYSKLTKGNSRQKLSSIIDQLFLIEEFLVSEMEQGKLDLGQFSFRPNIKILHHVHCHQRALGQKHAVSKLLNSVPGWICEEIKTGCCGMAGGFGYEKEHYELSQKVAELGLFPAIRDRQDHYTVASGMSCRHQIHDGLQRKTHHPAAILLKFME